MLDDTEVLFLEPKGVSPGSTIAVEYRFRSLSDIPQDFFRIQEPIPVRHASVKVDARGGWRVRAKVAGGANPGPSDVTGEGAWEFTDLPGRPASPQSLSPAPPRLILALDYLPPGRETEFRDWAATARWGAALFQEDPNQPRFEREAARLRAEGGDPIDRVGRTVRKLRYFAIEIGWGGYRPRTPETTLVRGFGDCKDKSELMVCFLRKLGVEAFPVLAVAPSDGFVPDAVPGPRHFNHCVVGIPWKGRERSSGMSLVETEEFGPLRIFDPTLSEKSAQDIHYALEGGAALPLDPRTTRLLRLPRSGGSENLFEKTSRWRLGEDGTLEVRMTARHLGVTRMYLEGDGEELLTNKELRRRLFDAASRLHPRLEGFEIGNIRREGVGAWTYETSYRAGEALATSGDLGVLSLPPLHDLDLFPIPNEKKPVSLHQAYLATFRDVVELEFPGRTLADLPKAFETANTLGVVSVVVRQEDERLIIERKVVTRSLEIAPDKREEANALRRALRRANAIAVVLESEGIGS